MKRETFVSFDEIKRGLSAANPTRAKYSPKVDFKIKKIEEPFSKFGNQGLCQGDDPTYGMAAHK